MGGADHRTTQWRRPRELRSVAIAVHDQTTGTEFDVIGFGKSLHDRAEIFSEQGKQHRIGDVAGLDGEEASRGSTQQVAVAKVPVFGDNDPILVVGQIGESGVGDPVSFWKL